MAIPYFPDFAQLQINAQRHYYSDGFWLMLMESTKPEP